MDCVSDIDIIWLFNQFLTEICRVPYTVECVELKGVGLDRLKEFTNKQKTCHSATGAEGGVPYALFVMHNEEIVAYASFSSSDEISGPDKYCSSYLPIKGLAIEFMCTDDKHRGKGLIQLLTLIIIVCAKRANYEVVVAAVNAASAHILKKYFGFEVDEDPETFMRELCAFQFSIQINARLKLTDEHLVTLRQTYNKFIMCEKVGKIRSRF